MLTDSQIKPLATKLQTTEQNVVMEYCQHLFLSNFYQSPKAENILFKGGTALRIAFDSPRFSEDLDFSGFGSSQDEIEGAVIECLEKIPPYGVETEILEAKKTSGGYLAQVDFHWNDYQQSIGLEISLRDKPIRKETTVISSEYIPSYPVFLLETALLIEEKMKASIDRKKPRDFFDIYFLLRSGLIKPEQKNILKQIKNAFESSNINFSKELKQFLPASMSQIAKNFPLIFETELKRNIS